MYVPDWYRLQSRGRLFRQWGIWKPWIATVILPEGDPRKVPPTERCHTEQEARGRAYALAEEMAAGGRGRVVMPHDDDLELPETAQEGA